MCVSTLYTKSWGTKITRYLYKKVCRLMHLFHDSKLPTAYKAYFRPIRQQHNHGIRSASNQNLILPRCNTTGGLKPIQEIGAKHWNKISEVIEKLPLNKFIKHLVSDLLNNYLEIWSFYNLLNNLFADSIFFLFYILQIVLFSCYPVGVYTT